MENNDKSNQIVSETFQPLDFFMLRAPLLSINLYRDYFESLLNISDDTEVIEKIKKLPSYGCLLEAIAVSSPSLVKSFIEFDGKKKKKKRDQVVKNMVRYLIRMTTRSTPFGLFSGVGVGSFSTRTEITLGSVDQHKKRARPDMEWLLNIIHELESNIEIIKQLKIQTNTMIYNIGNRSKIPFKTISSTEGINGSLEEPSIKKNKVVSEVFEIARKPILFQTLLEKVKVIYPETPLEIVTNFIWELFRQEFFISELRPSMTMQNPFNLFLEKIQGIKGIDEIKKSLNNISSNLEMYNKLPVGQGYELLKVIENEMKMLADVKTPLQVDVALNSKNILLNEAIRDEIAVAVEAFIRLSDFSGLEHMEKYKIEFLERYGENREVPLLELLDEDIGLGPPPTYMNPQGSMTLGNGNANQANKQKNIMMEWLIDAITKGQKEIVLDEASIEKLSTTEYDPGKAPLSLELYFNVIANSKEDVDQDNFLLVLGANPGSNGAGKTFGRFRDILSEETNIKINEIYDKEQMMEPENIFAEMSFQDVRKRISNIVLSINDRGYEIPVATNSSKDEEHTLPVSDLVVGVNNRNFYLKSLKLNKRIIPTAGNMLNYLGTPNVYRFLNEIALEGRRNLKFDLWGALKNSPFLPRIRHGKVIMSPQRWCIGNSLPVFSEVEKSNWDEAFNNWVELYSVPRYVYLAEADNRILLDLHHPLHIKEIKTEFLKLKPGSHLIFYEAFMNDWVESPEGFHATEFVFPIINQHKLATAEKESREQKPAPQEPIPNMQRMFFPGSDCLFLKLYCPKSRIEEFIAWYLPNFCNAAEADKSAVRSFYMRYKDPDSHIRLRFFGEPARLVSELIPKIYSWSKNLQSEGILNKIVFDTYDPEIERYGGPTAIKLAENVFSVDSKITAGLINLKRSNEISLSYELLGVINIIDYLECFALSISEQIRYLNAMVSYKEYNQEFRENKGDFILLCNAKNNWQNLKTHAEGQRILNIISPRRVHLEIYHKKIRELEREGSLYSKPNQILGSLIHLHMNRLIGVDRVRETKIMTLALHTLRNLEYIVANEVGE